MPKTGLQGEREGIFFTCVYWETGLLKTSCWVFRLESSMFFITQNVQLHWLLYMQNTWYYTSQLFILSKPGKNSLSLSLSLTQVSLHLQLVGDSANEKLVDIRHNTPDLPQSHTQNICGFSAGTRQFWKVWWSCWYSDMV